MSNLTRIDHSYGRAYISQHYEGWEPRAFERYDLQNYLDTLDRQNTDVVIVTARTHNGYWYTDIGTGTMHPGLHGVDQLQEAIRYFHKKNKMVVAYFSVVYDKEQFDLHPEWQEVDRDGHPLGGGSFSKVVCMNSPYREYVLYMLQTLMEKRDLDGVLVDMPFFEPTLCYCNGCRETYRAMYGREIPSAEDYDSEAFKDYIDMRYQSNMTFVQEITDCIKKVKPDALAYMQFDLLKVGSRDSQTWKMAGIADYVYSDLYFSYGTIQTSLATKVQSLLTKHPPEMGIMTRPGSHNDTPNMQPLDQIRSEAFTILANGGAVHLFDIMWPDGYLQDAMWDRNARVFSEIRQREPWLGGKSKAQVAVFYSEENNKWFGREDKVQNVMSSLFGTSRALLESHIPFDVVCKVDEETLERYDVLVLPNIACLSDAECAAIRDFVKRGGGLVSTSQTSRYDARGHSRLAFALGDVMGIAYIGADTAAYSRVYTHFDIASDIAAGLPKDGMITSWGVLPKLRPLDGATVVGTITYPYTEPNGDRFINIMANPPAVPSEWPACVTHAYGNGKSVYFAGDPGKDYVELSFPELRTLLANAVRSVLGKPEMVVVDEKYPLEVTLYQNAVGQKVIHLVNQLFDYGRTMYTQGTWKERSNREQVTTRNLIQHVCPQTDIPVAFVAQEPVLKVTLEPAHKELAFTQKGNVVKVIVPHLACHEMIVVE